MQERRAPLGCPSLLVVGILELEEVLGIVVADILNHLTYALHLTVGNLAVLHIAAYEVAQCATEILVARVGEERA